MLNLILSDFGDYIQPIITTLVECLSRFVLGDNFGIIDIKKGLGHLDED